MGREIFKRIAESATNNKGDYLSGGMGRVVVLQHVWKEPAKGVTGGPSFVVRVKVLSSQSKGQTDKENKPVPVNTPGSRAGWVQKPEQFASAMGNIKSYLLSALGFAESDVTSDEFADTLEQSLGKEQPMRGMLVDFDSYQSATKKDLTAKNTYITWKTVKEGNSPEEVAARRAELDKTDPISI